MKTIVTAAILGAMGLAGATSADAQDVRRHPPGNAPRHESRHDPRHEPRHEVRHDSNRGFFNFHFGFAPRPAPRVEQVWIAPRYQTVLTGYECGRPVYRTVCVAEGYWTTQTCD